MLSGKMRDAVIVLVSIAWLASIAGQIFNPEYKPDASINAAFALVVGAAIGAGKKDNDREDPPQRRGR